MERVSLVGFVESCQIFFSSMTQKSSQAFQVNRHSRDNVTLAQSRTASSSRLKLRDKRENNSLKGPLCESRMEVGNVSRATCMPKYQFNSTTRVYDSCWRVPGKRFPDIYHKSKGEVKENMTSLTGIGRSIFKRSKSAFRQPFHSKSDEATARHHSEKAARVSSMYQSELNTHASQLGIKTAVNLWRDTPLF